MIRKILISSLPPSILALTVACAGCEKESESPPAEPAKPRATLKVVALPPQKGEPTRLFGRDGLYCAERHGEPDLACVGTDVFALQPEVPEPDDVNRPARTRANTPVVVRDFRPIEIGVGCARWEDQAVRCWNPTHHHAVETTPVLGLEASVSFSNWYEFGQKCSVGSSGEVLCWETELCNPSDERSKRAPLARSPVAGLPPASVVSVGQRIACAIDRSGKVWCWGYVESRNECAGQVAQLVPSVDDAVEIVTGRGSACARSGSGEIACWGDNWFGVLGVPESEVAFATEPMAMAGVAPAVELQGRDGEFVALKDDGEVWIWGWPLTGDKENLAPRRVEGIDKAIDIVIGSENGCALLHDHNLRCFGARIERGIKRGMGRPAFEDKATWLHPRAYRWKAPDPAPTGVGEP